MSAFSEKHVAAAIGRLPEMSNKDIRELRKRAEGQGLGVLLEACDEELTGRPIEFTGDAAKTFDAQAREVVDMSLADAIRHAFTHAPSPSPDEIQLLRWFAANPGGSYQAAVKASAMKGSAFGSGIWSTIDTGAFESS
jgi:hypothetical protein